MRLHGARGDLQGHAGRDRPPSAWGTPSLEGSSGPLSLAGVSRPKPRLKGGGVETRRWRHVQVVVAAVAGFGCSDGGLVGRTRAATGAAFVRRIRCLFSGCGAAILGCDLFAPGRPIGYRLDPCRPAPADSGLGAWYPLPTLPFMPPARDLPPMRTRASHPLQIAELAVPGVPGRLGLTFCPGKRQRHAATGAWAALAPGLHRRLGAGERVLLHCKGGLGRTGTIAARLLVERGMTPDAAIRARGLAGRRDAAAVPAELGQGWVAGGAGDRLVRADRPRAEGGNHPRRQPRRQRRQHRQHRRPGPGRPARSRLAAAGPV